MSLFVVLEGPDGVGKTTVQHELATYLHRYTGQAPTLTGEPTHLPIGQLLRRERASFSTRVRARLFAADRLQHCELKINPALDRAQKIVVCDRYVHSSYVYQARGSVQLDDIKNLNVGIRQPDITFVLLDRWKDILHRRQRRAPTRTIVVDEIHDQLDRYRWVVSPKNQYLREPRHPIDVAGRSPTSVVGEIMDTLKEQLT